MIEEIRSLLGTVDVRDGPDRFLARHLVGGAAIDVAIPSDRAWLIDAMSHLRTPLAGPPALEVEVRFAPHPGWLRSLDFEGHLVVDEDDVGLHLGHDGALALFDKIGNRALWWFDTAHVARWHFAAPLRQILHWHCVHRGQALLHAAAVSSGGRAALITGPGGSGKSTTSLLCHRAGLGFLGDDYCVVEPTGDGVDVFGLYRTAKVTERSRRLFRSPLEHAFLEVDQEKRAVYLDDALAGPVPADALFIARVDETLPSHRAPATRMQALAAAGPTSVLQQRGGGALALGILAAAVRKLPAEHLVVSRDVEEVPRLIEAALREHRR
jgi:hypothetical protein